MDKEFIESFENLICELLEEELSQGVVTGIRMAKGFLLTKSGELFQEDLDDKAQHLRIHANNLEDFARSYKKKHFESGRKKELWTRIFKMLSGED